LVTRDSSRVQLQGLWSETGDLLVTGQVI